MDQSGLALSPKSLGEQVAETLRDAILTGRLAPGQAMREATLAQEVGVARNTVREALRILAGERLVTYQLHHGVVVSTLTEDDVMDLYDVRALLEPAALLDSARHTPAAIQGVLDAIRRLEDATNQSELTTVVERDLDVHRAIVALGNSPRINDFFTDICAEVRRCVLLVIYAHAEHQSSHNVEGHRVIADALVAREYGRAAELALAHVNETRARVLQLIRDNAMVDPSAPSHVSPPVATNPSRPRNLPRRSQRSSTSHT